MKGNQETKYAEPDSINLALISRAVKLREAHISELIRPLVRQKVLSRQALRIRVHRLADRHFLVLDSSKTTKKILVRPSLKAVNLIKNQGEI